MQFFSRVKKDTIDEHLGVFRFDDAQGKPLATIWNFAIHGVCYGPEYVNRGFLGNRKIDLLLLAT